MLGRHDFIRPGLPNTSELPFRAVDDVTGCWTSAQITGHACCGSCCCCCCYLLTAAADAQWGLAETASWLCVASITGRLRWMTSGTWTPLTLACSAEPCRLPSRPQRFKIWRSVGRYSLFNAVLWNQQSGTHLCDNAGFVRLSVTYTISLPLPYQSPVWPTKAYTLRAYLRDNFAYQYM